MSDYVPFTYTIPSTLPADPVLREFFPEFLTRWIADIDSQWPDIMQRRDTAELRRFGHTIRGSFIQFGLRDMSEAGLLIMNHAQSEDWVHADDVVQHIRRALCDIQSALPTLMSKDTK